MNPVDLPDVTKGLRPPANRYTVRLARGRNDIEAALRLLGRCLRDTGLLA